MLIPVPHHQHDHFYGDPLSPVVLIQYGDFQCRHCADAYIEIKRLLDFMGRRLAFVFRHFPMQETHPFAEEAAIACEIAAMQGKFWYMHDIIFENQPDLSPGALLRFAKDIDIDPLAFTDMGLYRQLYRKVMRDYEGGARNGVDGTPVFFINGRRFNAFSDYDSLSHECMREFAKDKLPAEKD